MKITCHACAAKYTVSDEKVQGKTVKMKCRKCGATIVVGGTGAQEGEVAVSDDGGMAQAEATPAGSFLVNVADGDQRTMTLAEIMDAYNGGVVTADTYVWSDAANDWQALGENEAIVAALNAGAGGHGNGTNGNGGYDAAPYAEPAAAPMAMASDSGRGAAKKERKAQDLFGGGYNDSMGSSASLASASPSAAGKRDENSVLFSLSALTSSTGPTAPAPTKSATTATKEDSGLIDLKALAANAPPPTASQAAAVATVDTIGLFPLGAPVLAAPQAAAMSAPLAAAAPQEKSKLPLIIGGVVAIAAVVGVFMVVKGGGGDTTASAAKVTPTAEAAPTVPQPVATAIPTETATAAAPEASASAAASGKPVAGTWKGKGTATAKGTATGAAPPTTATGAKTATPPARGNCGCAPSDLNCAMKCAAKGK